MAVSAASGKASISILKTGTGTVPPAGTSVAVAHGLGRTPIAANITITPTSSWGSAAAWWVSATSATTFTVTTNAAPGGAGLAFGWAILIAR